VRENDIILTMGECDTPHGRCYPLLKWFLIGNSHGSTHS
jgi:hypothetical protein